MSDHDLAAAYALDALDDSERAAFEAHLAGCAACRQEIAEFRLVTDELARSLAEEPPARLRSVVLAEVARTPQEPVASAPSAEPAVVALADRRRRRPALWAGIAVGVAAAAVIAVLGVQLSSSQRERDRAAAVAEVLAAPDAQVLTFTGASGSGRLVSSATYGHSVLVLDGMPALPSDRAYQLWFIAGGTPTGAGVFSQNDGRVVGRTESLPPGVDQVAVTEEPSSGSPQPTGPILLSATPAS